VTEALEELRQLAEYPAAAPYPVDELHRRVAARSRRRNRRRAALAGLAAVVSCVAAIPLLHRVDDRPTRVATGPGPGSVFADTTTGPPGTRLEFSVPDGWETLSYDGHQVVLATRPLTNLDLRLALLGRADPSFGAFPADAVVVVVGFDPLEPKYGTHWDGTQLDPGPPYALGRERVLPGGVRFRRGDVPQSMMRIASYAGPAAVGEPLRQAEEVAGSLRLVPTGQPAVAGPVTPGGSGAQVLPEVARAGTGDSSMVLEAGDDCAFARPAGSRTQVAGQDRLGGGCGARPAGSGITAVGPAFQVWGDPGTPPSSAGIVRVGPGVRTVSATTADGRSVAADLGKDGWAIAVTGGRIVTFTAFDAQGGLLDAVFIR
jgi:hypothetical protein